MSLLQQFWEWLGISSEQYAIETSAAGSSNKDFEEYMFPFWNALLNEAESIVKENRMDKNSLETLLTIMALDNETEDVLDYVSIHGSEQFVEKLVNAGALHCQRHARWQTVELLGRRHPKKWNELLCVLSKDKDLYVARRAGNILQIYLQE